MIEWRKKAISAKIRCDMQATTADEGIGGEWRYYLHLPDSNKHQNHFMPTDTEVCVAQVITILQCSSFLTCYTPLVAVAAIESYTNFTIVQNTFVHCSCKFQKNTSIIPVCG